MRSTPPCIPSLMLLILLPIPVLHAQSGPSDPAEQELIRRVRDLKRSVLERSWSKIPGMTRRETKPVPEVKDALDELRKQVTLRRPRAHLMEHTVLSVSLGAAPPSDPKGPLLSQVIQMVEDLLTLPEVNPEAFDLLGRLWPILDELERETPRG